MASRSPSLLYRVRRLLAPPGEVPASDRALLDRYADGGDGAAFRELLERHGPLVLGVCQRVLGDADLAEDVFQATFLVLARNPSAVRGRDSIGPWLYAVARRLARRVLSERAAERRREQKVAAARPTFATVDFATRELLAVLDEELDRLPDRLRAPLLLCYLQGHTQDEAARQLGWSLSTLRRRLEKGSALLRLRLTQRGATLGAALFAGVIAPEVFAAVPAGLADSTMHAAWTFAAGGDQYSTAVRIAQEGLRMLICDRLKLAASLLLGFGLLTGTGTGVLLAMRPADPPEPATPVQAPAVAATKNDVRQRLSDLWQTQRETTSRGRFEVVLVRAGLEKGQELSRAEFDRLLSGLRLNDVPGFLQKLLDRCSPLRPGITRIFGPLKPIEVRVDGRRHLERWSSQDPKFEDKRHVSFSDGNVFVEYEPMNKQASVYKPYIYVLGINDLRYLPIVPGKGLDEKWEVVETKNGRVRLRYASEPLASELEADERTGFIYVSRSPYSTDGTMTRENLQFGPVADRVGRLLPTVNIEVTFNKGQLSHFSAHHVVKADLDATFTDADFAIAAPAGTNVLDFRSDHDNPKSRVAREAVPDVLAFANAIPDRTRAIWPRLRYGTPAPKLALAAWLTQKGKAETPNLKGKIVLIDFWGTTCGPCIAELPDVQAAAKKYAESDLVLIGLHDAGAKVEDVTGFASKHELTYLLGIDRPADKGSSFGATFQAFGIRAIPNAAVIDREGRIAFVGRFKDGLQKAEELLKGGHTR